MWDKRPQKEDPCTSDSRLFCETEEPGAWYAKEGESWYRFPAKAGGWGEREEVDLDWFRRVEVFREYLQGKRLREDRLPLSWAEERWVQSLTRVPSWRAILTGWWGAWPSAVSIWGELSRSQADLPWLYYIDCRSEEPKAIERGAPQWGGETRPL